MLVLSASLFILQVVAVPIDDNQHHLLERVTRNGNDLPFYYPDSISNVVNKISLSGHSVKFCRTKEID
jgi:hypothetical protein